LLVTAVGGAIGGLAGALFAPIGGIVHPSFFGLALSLQVFIWVAVGGQGTLWGPMAAAVVIKLVEGYLSGVTTDLYLVIIAAGFVLAVLLLPGGIAGRLTRISTESAATGGGSC
jgi:ABC-type branched-subunit amino acid transport system permease subunit